MTEFHDPERAAAVCGALDRLLDLMAREIARELQADVAPAAKTSGPCGADADPAEGRSGNDE